MCTETGSNDPIQRKVRCLDGTVPNILLLNGFLHLQFPDLIRAQSDDTCGHSYDDRADSDTGEYDEQFSVMAWIAFILLLLEMLLMVKKNPKLKDFNLFK